LSAYQLAVQDSYQVWLQAYLKFRDLRERGCGSLEFGSDSFYRLEEIAQRL